MLFMSVPPHQGDEWVLLIWCARLTFAVSFGSFQAATVPSLIPGRRERKRETARNNEAWDQLAQQEFGFSLPDVPLHDCVSLTHVTGGCCTGRIKKG